MNKIDNETICEYVNNHIESFHSNRIERIKLLNLEKLINKNPYLYKAKNLESASLLINGFLEAFLSSSEEKMFGDFLEGLAIFIADKTRSGHKSASAGIDLEIVEGNSHYLLSIKSGPNWGNNAQHLKLVQDFDLASRIINQRNPQIKVFKILGICYGKTKTTLHAKGYWKIIGQNFWTFISGNKDLYTEIIEPIGFRAKEHNFEFEKEKNKFINKMTEKFINSYCRSDGGIDWEKLVKHNSGNYDLDRINL